MKTLLILILLSGCGTTDKKKKDKRTTQDVMQQMREGAIYQHQLMKIFHIPNAAPPTLGF